MYTYRVCTQEPIQIMLFIGETVVSLMEFGRLEEATKIMDKIEALCINPDYAAKEPSITTGSKNYPTRSFQILNLLFDETLSLSDIAKKCNISRSRVGQIYSAARASGIKVATRKQGQRD